MKNYKLSTRLFSEIFWKTIFGNMDSESHTRKELLNETNTLNKLRMKAEYNTGSISFASSWSLYSLIKYFEPSKIVEVGTFIGKSTWSMAKALDELQNTSTIYTCDSSNDLDIPWKGRTEIRQFKKTTSTNMFSQISDKIDFLFLDGRINQEDINILSNLLHSKSIIVMDDFEGIEKGVANLFALRRMELLKNHFLIYPCEQNYLYKLGFSSHSLTAVLIPTTLIELSRQDKV